MHPRLRKQLGAQSEEKLSPEWRSFLDAVGASYRDADAEMARSVDSVKTLLALLHRAQEEEAAGREAKDGRREKAEQVARRARQTLDRGGLAWAETGPSLVIRSANASAMRLCGVEDMPGKSVFAVLVPVETDALTLSWNARLARGEPILQRLSCRTQGNRVLSCDWVCIPKLTSSGKLDSVRIFWRDESARTDTHAELAVRDERMLLALAGSGGTLFDWNLETDQMMLSPDGVGLAETPAGWTNLPSRWLDRVHPEDVTGLNAAIAAHLDGQAALLEHEVRIRPGRSDWRWVSMRGAAVRHGLDKPVRIVGLLMDSTRHRAEVERLAHGARHDALTSLPNRTLFLDLLRHSLLRTRRHSEYRFAVLFIDIDRFKAINDSLGHEAGDQLLIQIARRLESTLRQGDTLARHGGDEFTMWVDDVRNPEDALRVSERIQEAMRAPFDVGDQRVQSSASIGVAIASALYLRAEDVVRDADFAMYRAKAQGRARTALFKEERAEHAHRGRPLEADLRSAIEQNQLRVYYLPIVDVASGVVNGVEALARWQHPRLGLVSPERFLAMAIDTGLIVDIDHWVLRTASLHLRDWRTQAAALARLTLSVNLSEQVLGQQDLPASIDAVLRESALLPRDLILDITEAAVAQSGAPSVALTTLRSRGVVLHIDDFGMGNSWLRHLHLDNVDSIKMDRSFLAGNARTDRQVMTRIVSIARDLGKRVIAEGVETDEQFRFLKTVGCDSAQGYLFSNPIDAEGTRAFLTSRLQPSLS